MTQTRTGLVAGPPIIVLRACLFRECRREPFLHPIPEGLTVIRPDHPTRQEFRGFHRLPMRGKILETKGRDSSP